MRLRGPMGAVPEVAVTSGSTEKSQIAAPTAIHFTNESTFVTPLLRGIDCQRAKRSGGVSISELRPRELRQVFSSLPIIPTTVSNPPTEIHTLKPKAKLPIDPSIHFSTGASVADFDIELNKMPLAERNVNRLQLIVVTRQAPNKIFPVGIRVATPRCAEAWDMCVNGVFDLCWI